MKSMCGVLLSLTVLAGCAGSPQSESAGAETPAAAEVDPAEGILPRPFTAEQIRDEWVVGFRLTLRRAMQGTQSLERWTVVGADEEGVEIEYASLDPAGAVTGEPTVGRSTWVELRDHASFPADRAERTQATRETTLGAFEGWVYTVRENDRGATSEFFFARDLPGAPLEMRTTQNGNVVAELEQIERHRPTS